MILNDIKFTVYRKLLSTARRSPTIYRLRAKSLMHESIGQTEKLVTSVSRETLYQPLRAK
jgi:hypothetical protein